MSTPSHRHVRVGRRAFVENGALCLAAAAIAPTSLLASQAPRPVLRVGLVTDLHYADKEPINREFSALAPDRHYVLGNDCVDTLTKDEFLAGVGQERSYYSFDRAGLHFVVLDACFRGDGQPYGRRNSTWTDANIPREEVEWLQADLTATDRPVVVFVHQRLDVSNQYGVRNASEVRRTLERSGRVVAVLQGHSHQNDYREIGGIHYATLVAMVEGSGTASSGYSLMDVAPDGGIVLRGFRRQANYRFG